MDGDFAPLAEALDVRLRSPEVRPVVEDDDTRLALHDSANGIIRRTREDYDGAMPRGVTLVLALTALALTACSRTGPTGGPTPVPIPPSIRELPGRGVAIEGKGSAESDEVTPQYNAGLPIGIDVVTLTHDGQSSFIVTAVQGDQSENLTSAIGAYKGQRPLVVQGPVSFQVTADGACTLRIQPMPSTASPPFPRTRAPLTAL